MYLRQLATDFTQQDAQNGALTINDFLHPPKLLGVGIAAGTTPQFLAFLGKGLLEFDADVLGRLHHFVPGNFEESAIDRVGDGFLLHGAVDNHPFEFCRLDRFGLNRRIDSGLEQFFYSGFANGGAKSSYLGGVARQSRLVVVHPAEVLPDDVLRPSLDEGFVTQVVGMLEVQQ